MSIQNQLENNLITFLETILRNKGANLGSILLSKEIKEFCTYDLDVTNKYDINPIERYIVFNADIILSALLRHFQGDYGLIANDADDYMVNASSRSSGLPFMSMYQIGSEYITVVTLPNASKTTVCFDSEY